MIFLNFHYHIYLWLGQPQGKRTRIEIYNESYTILMSYLLLFFTDFMDDPDIKYYVGGYGFMALFGLNVASNILFIIVEMVKLLVKKFLIWRQRFRLHIK